MLYDSFKLKFKNMQLMCTEESKNVDFHNHTEFEILLFTEGNPEVIKLGVTSNPNRRGEGTEYHGYFYKNYKIIYEGTREQVSEIEYRTKIEFINDICLGNEGFTFSAKDNIIDFINNIIKDF